MYTPAPYVERDLGTLHDRMRDWSFATLVTCGDEGIHATHLPFLLETRSGARGTLVTHFARANGQYQDLAEGASALVIFQGPHAFISPSWYKNRLTFPTWNYTAIHARGRPELVEDEASILGILQETVSTYDAPLAGDWTLAGVPETLTRSRISAIVGVRIPLDSIEGKMKVNQDKSVEDRLGVISALERQGGENATAIARMIREQPDVSEALNGVL